MVNCSHAMSRNGCAVWRRRATVTSRCACRAARRPSLSMKFLRRRRLRSAFHGIVRSVRFWGDERFVPHDHPDSNFRMAREAFLSLVPRSRQQYPRGADGGLVAGPSRQRIRDDAKAIYGADTLAPGRPLFDVTLLGIGEDGDTALLFPGQPTLQETSRWAVAVIGAKAEARINIDLPGAR